MRFKARERVCTGVLCMGDAIQCDTTFVGPVDMIPIRVFSNAQSSRLPCGARAVVCECCSVVRVKASGKDGWWHVESVGLAGA